jgi:hypothetical protein
MRDGGRPAPIIAGHVFYIYQVGATLYSVEYAATADPRSSTTYGKIISEV